MPLSLVAEEVRATVTPTPEQAYQLWSVPSFREKKPEEVLGSAIRSAKLRVEPGDVLLCKINPRINRVWKVEEPVNGRTQVASPEWSILRTAQRGYVTPEYLRQYLSSPAFRGWIEQATSGVTGSHTRAKSSQILKQLLPVPSIPEQRRIVDILEDHLSRLDAATALANVASLRLAALRRSWLAAVMERDGRKWTLLGNLVQRIEAGRSFGGAAGPATGEQWGIIKVSAMTWGAFRSDENKAISAHAVDPRHEIMRGDLLVSRANTSAYVGASVIVDEVRPRLLLSDKSLRIVPVDSVDRGWLQLALSSPRARTQISQKATGTKDSMRNISQAALLAVEVPDVVGSEQIEDAALIREQFFAITRLAAAVDAAKRKQAGLRRSLLSAAFSGRLTGRVSYADVIEELDGMRGLTR